MNAKNLTASLSTITLLLFASAARAESPAPAVTVALGAARDGHAVVLRVASLDAADRRVTVRRIAPGQLDRLAAEAIPVADTGLAARTALAIETPVTTTPGAIAHLRFEVELEIVGTSRRDLYVVDQAFLAMADGTLRPLSFAELLAREPATITLSAAPLVYAAAEGSSPAAR